MPDHLINAALRYPNSLWELLLELAPWLFFGLFLSGVVGLLIPEKRVQLWLGAGRRWAVLRAALVGVPLPLCSCGVVPVAISLRRQGASRGATVSFLITTPQSGLDSIAATWGLMGPVFAVFRTVLTFISGIFAGLVVQAIENESPEDFKIKQSVEEDTSSHSLIRRLVNPGWNILLSIGGWLTVGILLAALIDVLVPENFVSNGFLSGSLGMIVLALIALPLYICATASIPLAMEFVDKGFSLGAAFVFLLVGPATNLATALIVRKEIGNRSMVAYLGSILIFGLASGWCIDYFIDEFTVLSNEHMAHTGWLSQVTAGALSIILVYIVLQPIFMKFTQKPADSIRQNTFNVSGMTCEHCRRTVEGVVKGVQGVSQVTVDLKAGSVSHEGGDQGEIQKMIVEAGYEIT